MEIIAFVLAVVAVVLFLVVAFQTRPVNLLALGLASVSTAVLIWHSFGGLEPLFD